MREAVVVMDDGEPIHVRLLGDAGPRVMFLHGWTASHLEWSPFIRNLAQECRVVCWDARGHGGHQRRARTVPTAARMARDLEAVIDALGLAGAGFVGHSMGALTLWQYLRDFGSAKLGRLCFVDQSPKLVTDAGWPFGIYGDFDAARSAAFVDELRGDFAEAVLRLTALGRNDAARAGYLADSPGWQRARQALAGLEAGPLIACWESLVAADYRDVVPAIDRPSLLVYGACSNFYPLGVADWLAERIPDARVSIYEGANHSPHLCDRPRFTTELLDFIRERAGGPAP